MTTTLFKTVVGLLTLSGAAIAEPVNAPGHDEAMAFAKSIHNQAPVTADLSVHDLNRLLIFSHDRKTLILPNGPLCEYQYSSRRGVVTFTFDPQSGKLINAAHEGDEMPVVYSDGQIAVGKKRVTFSGSTIGLGSRRFTYEGQNAFSVTKSAGKKEVSVFAKDGLLKTATASMPKGEFGFNAITSINEARTLMTLSARGRRADLTFEFGPRDTHGNPSYYALINGTDREQFDLRYTYCAK